MTCHNLWTHKSAENILCASRTFVHTHKQRGLFLCSSMIQFSLQTRNSAVLLWDDWKSENEENACDANELRDSNKIIIMKMYETNTIFKFSTIMGMGQFVYCNFQWVVWMMCNALPYHYLYVLFRRHFVCDAKIDWMLAVSLSFHLNSLHVEHEPFASYRNGWLLMRRLQVYHRTKHCIYGSCIMLLSIN